MGAFDSWQMTVSAAPADNENNTYFYETQVAVGPRLRF